MADRGTYGLLVEFASPEALLEGARRLRAIGYRKLEAYSPFPVDGLDAVLGLRDARVPHIGFIGGALGAALALGVEYGVNYDFPIEIGGRPLYAFPAFLVVGFEITVLGAVVALVAAMLVLNGLPRLNHPVFEAQRFRLASDDRFFLCLRFSDPRLSGEHGHAIAARDAEAAGGRIVTSVP